MKINKKTIIVATLVGIFFTALPLAAPMLLPSELFYFISKQGGIDIGDLLNRIAILGMTTSILVLLRDSVEMTSRKGLTISIGWKIFLFIIVIFAMSLGKIENFGLVILSSGGNCALNTVIFDLRLFAILTTVVATLNIVHSVLEFKKV